MGFPAELRCLQYRHGGYDVAAVGEYRPESGRYEAQSVCVTRRGIEITGEGLRGVQLAGILREGVVHVVTANAQSLLPGPDPRELAAQGSTDETLRAVARIYRLALLLGDPPTRRVVEALGVPRATAGRWVTRARDRGFLTVQDPRGGRRD